MNDTEIMKGREMSLMEKMRIRQIEPRFPMEGFVPVKLEWLGDIYGICKYFHNYLYPVVKQFGTFTTLKEAMAVAKKYNSAPSYIGHGVIVCKNCGHKVFHKIFQDLVLCSHLTARWEGWNKVPRDDEGYHRGDLWCGQQVNGEDCGCTDPSLSQETLNKILEQLKEKRRIP